MEDPSERMEEPKARLMITKMCLENFKSYAGKREIGPFHKCFSAVVGPNGSGKSNVIDALLFVFGKRAKKLRLNKVSELVHKSSDHPNLEHAKVSVYFQDIIDTGDGDEDYRVVPDSHLTVSRTATVSNQSKYYLNDKPSTFSEVTEMLKKRGVDLDNNRFLILQGEVEQIAMMKPKAQTAHEEGLLEYLEDIIGSNKYVEPIEALEKEVEELNEARAEKLNRVRVTEKEKDNLEGSRAEAMAYLEKERELNEKTSILYQIYMHEAQSNATACEEKKAGLDDQIAKDKSTTESQTNALKELERDYNVLAKDQRKLMEQMDETKAEYTEFERRDITLREDLKHNKSQLKKFKGVVEKEKEKQKKLESKCEEYEEELPEMEKRISTLKIQLVKEEDVLETILDGLKDKTAVLREEMDVKEKEVAPYYEEINDTSSKIDAIKAEIQLLQETTKKAIQQRDEAVSRLETGKQTIEENSAALKSLADTMATKTRELKDLGHEYENLKANEAQTVKTSQEAQSRAEEAKKSVESHSAKNIMMKRMMEATKPGCALESAGLLGRLGDLGAIDQTYDVAISTACGALDHLVVKTTDGAQKCVQFLRKYNLGRATFIILEQLNYLRTKMTARFTLSSAKRLFDLVRVKDESVRPAFYFALRDTVVASTIDEATKIAYGQKRYRVVTMDGQLVELSGAMSGGGRQVRKGGMKSTVVASVSSEEVAALIQAAQDANRIVRENRDRQRQILGEQREIKKQLTQLESKRRKLELEIKSWTEQVKELTAHIPVLTEQCETSQSDQTKIQSLQSQMKAYEKEIKAVEKKASGLTEAIQDLKQQLLNVGGEKLKKQDSKVKSLSRELDETTESVAKMKVDVKSTMKSIEKSIAVQEKAMNEVKTLEENVNEKNQQLKTLEEEALAVHSRFETITSEMNEKDKVVREKKHIYDEAKHEIERLESEQVDLLHQLEECQRMVAENTAKVNHWQNKLEQLQETSAEIKILEPEATKSFNTDELKYQVTILETQRDELKENVNMASIEEYRKKEEEYNARIMELDTATEARDDKRRQHETMRRQRLDEFLTGFRVITLKLKEMYQMITLGGDSELELVDSLDPFSEGVVFSVRPSKKSWKNISNLSGGEKTLASLALVFALHHYKPTPLYVMDEIDAALDFKNVSIVGNYIKERTKNAQFIIISLRNNMFELADRLVGIYKTHNATKSVTINPKQYASLQAAPAPLQDRTNT